MPKEDSSKSKSEPELSGSSKKTKYGRQTAKDLVRHVVGVRVMNPGNAIDYIPPELPGEGKHLRFNRQD